MRKFFHDTMGIVVVMEGIGPPGGGVAQQLSAGDAVRWPPGEVPPSQRPLETGTRIYHPGGDESMGILRTGGHP